MQNKYLILADGNSPHILKWVKELVKYFDVYLISLNGVRADIYAFIEKEKVYIVTDKVNAVGGNYKLLFKVFKVRTIIKEIQPNYLNAHYLSSYGFFAALSKSAVPRMVLIQSTWGSDILLEPFKNIIRKKIAKYSLEKADYITSDSYHVSDTIEKFVQKKEIITFSFGFENLEKSSEKKQEVIFSNRALKDFYNIDKVLKWFALQNTKYSLVIANDGVERRYLEKIAKELKVEERVSFVGFLQEEDMQKYYKLSKYFISVPNSDGTAVSLLESMMYGCIPIVSNIPANREWILDFVNGIYFNEDISLENISIEDDFDKINFKILQRKALFPESIKSFISKVTE